MDREKVSFGGKTVYKDESPKEFERMIRLKAQAEAKTKRIKKSLQRLKNGKSERDLYQDEDEDL